jgi:CheY-like chemotaxis protein
MTETLETDTKHILIVDDEPKVGLFLGRSLELSNENCTVSTARTGEEALKILEQHHVDLLITDLRMPGASGLELIRWVKQSSPTTRTILITAYGNEQIRDQARRLEVYHYLTKPFNVKDFTEVVGDALQDLMVSAPGLTIMSDRAFEAINERLERLCYDVGARCVFMADMQGQRLAEVGTTEGLDSTMLLALLAGGFATSSELARRYNQGDAVNLNFQEGKLYDIYSANVGDNLIIAMVFDRRTEKSRIGMVWLYTRRAIDELLSVLSGLEDERPDQVLEEDFSSSVIAELETAFGGDFFEAVPAADLADTPLEPASDLPVADGGASGEGRATPNEVGPPAEQTTSTESSTDAATANEAKDDQELLTLEEAIKRGLLPSNFNMIPNQDDQA